MAQLFKGLCSSSPRACVLLLSETALVPKGQQRGQVSSTVSRPEYARTAELRIRLALSLRGSVSLPASLWLSSFALHLHCTRCICSTALLEGTGLSRGGSSLTGALGRLRGELALPTQCAAVGRDDLLKALVEQNRRSWNEPFEGFCPIGTAVVSHPTRYLYQHFLAGAAEVGFCLYWRRS